MNIKSALLSTLLLVISASVFSQVDDVCGIMGPQDSTAWGLGVIKMETHVHLTAVDQNNKTFSIAPRTISDGVKQISPAPTDFIFAGAYMRFLKVFEIKNTSYLVLRNSIEGGLWINSNELHSQRLTFNTYYQMLFNDNPDSREYWRNSLGSLGANLFKSCLNLRQEPSTTGKILKCIVKNENSDRFHNIAIREHKDTWAFIHVFEYIAIADTGDYGEGCAYKLDKEFRGWAKVIDDNGYPNLWYGLNKY